MPAIVSGLPEFLLYFATAVGLVALYLFVCLQYSYVAFAAGTVPGIVMGIGLLVLGGLLLVRVARQSERPLTPSTPEQLLAERYARGDIDEEEYRQRLGTLTDTGALRR